MALTAARTPPGVLELLPLDQIAPKIVRVFSGDRS